MLAQQEKNTSNILHKRHFYEPSVKTPSKIMEVWLHLFRDENGWNVKKIWISAQVLEKYVCINCLGDFKPMIQQSWSHLATYHIFLLRSDIN